MPALRNQAVGARCRGALRWRAGLVLGLVVLGLRASLVLAAEAGAGDPGPPLSAWQYQAVLEALRDPVVGTQHEALVWLALNVQPDRGERVPAGLVDELETRLSKARQPYERFDALAKLGFVGPAASRFAPELATLLSDRDPNMRAEAAWALAQMGEAGARFVSQIAELLGDRDSYVRGNAASALARMGEAGAPFAPQVAALLKDENRDVRRYAARALGEMGASGQGSRPRWPTFLTATWSAKTRSGRLARWAAPAPGTFLR